MRLENKVAIVTGSGKGLGKAMTLALAREGATVLVNYRTSAAGASAVVEYIKSKGGKAEAFQADIQNRDECKTLCEEAIGKYGRIDICVVGPGGGWNPEPIEKLNTTAALDDAQKELAPLYNLMPLVLPRMYAQKWGRFIGISLLLSKPSPSFSYDAAKAARTPPTPGVRDRSTRGRGLAHTARSHAEYPCRRRATSRRSVRLAAALTSISRPVSTLGDLANLKRHAPKSAK